jgi:hypothetical protein
MNKRMCKDCGEEKRMVKGVWRYARRHGCYGRSCQACTLAKYRAGDARRKRDNYGVSAKMKRELKRLQRENTTLRETAKRVLDSQDGY